MKADDNRITNPAVSVIIPVYNVKSYLKECLDSVAAQTYGNIEVWLIDDGSTDGSAEICDEYAQRFPAFHAEHFENAGLSEARNRGLRLARGQYVMFADSDDWLEPDTCEIAVRAAEEQHADVVIWSYIREYPDRSLPRSVLPEQPSIYTGEAYRRLYLSVVGPSGEGVAHPENLDVLSSAWNKLYKATIAASIRFTDTKEIGVEDLLYIVNDNRS